MDISTPKADAREGRILCRHPDGRLTVFADGLHAVFGLQYLDGRLYVLHNPRFSVFADRGDRGEALPDLIPSTNPEPWALDWNDHVPANFRWGLDGFFYVATGDKGLYRARGTDGRELSMRGGVFRIRPDGTGLKAFSQGVRNILDVALTPEDELFTYDNTDEHQWMSRVTHMVDGGQYGWPHDFIPRRDYTLWCLADYGGGAATGALVDDGGAWPAALAGQLYLADFGKRQVTRVRLERDGATFRAAEREDLFPSPPADFRPVGICQTADGTGLLTCDWQHRDSKAQATVGRLWKLTPEGARAPARPEWWGAAASGKPFQAADEELIAALSHAARPVRDVAQRRLAERPAAASALRALASDPSKPGLARIHALWALVPSGQATPEFLSKLAADGDAVVARQSLRRLGESGDLAAAPVLRKALDHEDATRRFRAATGLGRLGDPQSISELRQRLTDSDAWVRFAAFTALNRIGRAHPETWSAIAAGLGDAEEPIRTGTAYALRETWDAALVAVLSRLAAGREPAATAAVRLLGEVALKPSEWRGEWWAYHPANSPPPPRTERWDGTTTAEAALVAALQSPHPAVQSAALAAVGASRLEAAAPALEAMSRNAPDPARRRAALAARARLKDSRATEFFAAELLRNADPESRVVALGVLEQAPDSAAGRAALEQLWKTPPAEASVLAAACAATGSLRMEPQAPTIAQLTAHPDAAVRTAALTALGRMGTAEAVVALADALAGGIPETARTSLAALAGIPRPEARQLLLRAATHDVWRAEATVALTRRPDADAIEAYLGGLDLPDARVREQCRAALGPLREAAWPRVRDSLDRLSPSARAQLRLVFAGFAPAQESPLFQGTSAWTEADYLAATGASGGNESRGRELFISSQGPACSRCHKVGAEGGEIGPDLTHAGAQFDRTALAEAILFPSQSVREGYQQTTLELASGDTLSGLLRLEEADAVTLRDAEGRDHRVRKSDIRERFQSSTSLMPEGLAAGLTPADWSDLLAYLESLR